MIKEYSATLGVMPAVADVRFAAGLYDDIYTYQACPILVLLRDRLGDLDGQSTTLTLFPCKNDVISQSVCVGRRYSIKGKMIVKMAQFELIRLPSDYFEIQTSLMNKLN